MTNIFYVYEHWRTDKNQCFYVGKGKNYRALSVADRSKKHKQLMDEIFENGFAVEVKIVASGLSEDESLSLEQERIKFWKDYKVELINGNAFEGYTHSKEGKKRISQGQKRRRQIA